MPLLAKTLQVGACLCQIMEYLGSAICLLVVFYFCQRKTKDEQCPIAKLAVYYDHNVSVPKEKAKGKTEKKVNRWKLSLKMSSSE